MAHLDQVPNLGNQERTAVCRNVTDSQCLYAARCKRRMCKGEKRRGGVKKKEVIPGEVAPPIAALCAAGVTAGPGVTSPPRAFVPSAHSAAPKAPRLQQQHNHGKKKKKVKTPGGGRRLCISGRWQLSAPPQRSGVTVNGNLMFFFSSLLSARCSSRDAVTFV